MVELDVIPSPNPVAAGTEGEPVAWQYSRQEIVFGRLTEVKTIVSRKPTQTGIFNVRALYAHPTPTPGGVTVPEGMGEPSEADLERVARALCGPSADEDYNGRDAQMPDNVPMKRWELYIGMAKIAFASIASPSVEEGRK